MALAVFVSGVGGEGDRERAVARGVEVRDDAGEDEGVLRAFTLHFTCGAAVVAPPPTVVPPVSVTPPRTPRAPRPPRPPTTVLDPWSTRPPPTTVRRQPNGGTVITH